MNDIGKEFVNTARASLTKEYLRKFERCLMELSEDDIWWRSHETDNSVGNLILHLCGNMRQWIISGIGGKEFTRNRQQEFDERRHIPRQELLDLFKGTVTEAEQVLAAFDPSLLTEVRHFQEWDHTCLYAISHVIEHLSMHLGQIIYITKLRKAKDLKFFNL